jgi:hypothetical protein
MKLQEGWIAEWQDGKVQHAFVPSISSNPAILPSCHPAIQRCVSA